MNIKLIKHLTAASILCIANAVFAEISAEVSKKHNLEDIITTAEMFITTELNAQDDSTQIRVKPLDKRLQLHQCTMPLIAYWPPGASSSGHTTIGIRCNDYKPWKIYIGAEIKSFEQVWVSNTAISRGTLLSAKNISLEKREISSTHSEFFHETDSPIGLKTKRPLRKGDIIQVLALEKPMAIHRGDRVMVIARIGGLEIRTAASALSSAAQGDKIKVRNLSSNKVLEGIVSKNNVVHVNI